MDDYSVMQDGEPRDIGGGIRLQVSRNQDGSYDVAVSELRTSSRGAPQYGLHSWNTTQGVP